jgi:hypothetical protein
VCPHIIDIGEHSGNAINRDPGSPEGFSVGGVAISIMRKQRRHTNALYIGILDGVNDSRGVENQR